MTLNNVSRSLSDVGRSPSHVGDFSRRPLSAPAMTRMNGRQRHVATDATKIRNHYVLVEKKVFLISWFRVPGTTASYYPISISLNLAFQVCSRSASAAGDGGDSSSVRAASPCASARR